MSEIEQRLKIVRENILAACLRSGRDEKDVTLIAVSKTKPLEMIDEAFEAGCVCFGENRVQELKEKAEAFQKPAMWHLIGHLQVNKVKYLPGIARMIHSLDSEKLANEIDRQAQKHSLVMDVLCEVNVAGEESKFGLTPEETPAFVVKTVEACPHIRVRGLMTVAPRTDKAESNRVYFRALRELLHKTNALLPAEKQLTELSMGMSGDYTVAIEEGATMVRVGTGIFGARQYDLT